MSDRLTSAEALFIRLRCANVPVARDFTEAAGLADGEAFYDRDAADFVMRQRTEAVVEVPSG